MAVPSRGIPRGGLQVRRRAAGRRQRRAQAMAAHTAEEARFDNIKAHFGLDAGGILVALRSWQHLQQLQVPLNISSAVHVCYIGGHVCHGKRPGPACIWL